MMSHAVFPLQKAMYAALSGDATLSAMITGVYNDVPFDTDYPYVMIGEGRGRDISDVVNQKEAVRFALRCYSRADGAKEALGMADVVHGLLHQQSLSLDSGYSLEMLQVRQMDVAQSRDGETWVVSIEIEGRILIT